MDAAEDLTAARGGDEHAFRRLVDPYRRELRAHCYRMAGSLHDADDLVQESMIRAWRGLGGFEGRGALRGWLYRVATSACLDALKSKASRYLPHERGAPSPPDVMDPGSDLPWLEPCPDELLGATPLTAESQLDRRQSVAFAFLTAIQVLPPRQRAALLLCDVLGFAAGECAEILETTVAGVNSALQRARETLPKKVAGQATSIAAPDEATRAMLARYVEAWERADVPLLVTLLRDDATLAMPPMSTWLRGAADIAASIGGMVLTPEAAGVFKLVPTSANGLPAFAAYRREGEGWVPAAIHVLELDGARIAAIHAFLTPGIFPAFGLPQSP